MTSHGQIPEVPLMDEDFARITQSGPRTLARLMELEGPSTLSIGNFANLSSLATKLRRRADKVSQFLWGRFKAPTQQILSDFEGSSLEMGPVQNALVLELNRIIQGEPIYEARRFAGVVLAEKTQELLAQKPEGEKLMRLNRMLLEDAYPQEISKTVTEWLWGEMAAMFEHQLRTPIVFDLEELAPPLAQKLKTIRGSDTHFLRTFGELFHQEEAPVELLVLIMEFAEANCSNPDSPMPFGIARVLYFACMAKALGQGGRRIGPLDDKSMRAGFEWAAGLVWVDEDTRRVFREAHRLLNAKK
jgi:hypothetical protein